jgi:AcrR family transcriptional regulator
VARSRVPEQVAERRERITTAAAAVMVRVGVLATSLRLVAGQAELSTGSVLYYFDQFDDVVRAAIARVADEYDSSRRSAVEDAGNAVRALRQLVDLGLPDRLDGALAVLVQAHVIDDPGGRIAALLAELNRGQRRLYVDVIEQGVREGSFVRRERVADIARTAVAIEDAHSLYELRGYGPGMPGARRVLRAYLSDALGTRLSPARPSS